MYKCIYIFFVSLIVFANLNLYSIAEDLNIEKLIERLNTIENRIKVLEKATFSKTTPDFNNNVSLDDYQSIITKQSIQISELQNEIQFLTAKDPSAKNRSLKSVPFSDLLPSDQTGIASLEFVEITVSLACLIPGLPLSFPVIIRSDD